MLPLPLIIIPPLIIKVLIIGENIKLIITFLLISLIDINKLI